MIKSESYESDGDDGDPEDVETLKDEEDDEGSVKENVDAPLKVDGTKKYKTKSDGGDHVR